MKYGLSVVGIMLMTAMVQASEVVIYNTLVTPEVVTRYLRSANTPDFSGCSDCLINPDLSSLSGVPISDWVHDTGSIREMTAQEKADRDAANTTSADASLRTSSKAEFDGQTVSGQSLRCFAESIRKEINTVRGWTVSYKTEVAAATSLGDLQTRVAGLPTLGDRTLAQLKTSIQNCIDSGTVDE